MDILQYAESYAQYDAFPEDENALSLECPACGVRVTLKLPGTLLSCGHELPELKPPGDSISEGSNQYVAKVAVPFGTPTSREEAESRNQPKPGTGKAQASSAVEWRKWREDVAQACLSRAPSLLREWYPQGKQEGNQYRVGSIDGGEKGRSLTIWLDKGNFKDFSDDSVKGGNLIALYAHRFGKEFKVARDELAEQFNIPKPKRQSAAKWKAVTPVPEFAPRDEREWPLLNFPTSIAGELTRVWTYRDEKGRPLYCRGRWDTFDGGKEFRPITYCQSETGELSWRLQDLTPPRPLYGLNQLAARPNAPALLVEGEKTCDAAQQLLPDWVCVTFGSSKAIKNIDFSPLLVRKTRLVIWPDAVKWCSPPKTAFEQSIPLTPNPKSSTRCFNSS
jgi:hypothetical protein